MNNSFDYLISKFLLNYSEKDNESLMEFIYDDEYVSREFRKILDKIAKSTAAVLLFDNP